jgi:hypothetical protein
MIKCLKYPLLLTVLLTSMSFQLLYAQTLGNEWIVPCQTYYKIPIAKTGTYGISSTELVNAGIPLGTINPQKLQLWHRGIEQAIMVKGEGDGVFDVADSLVFFGEANDGTLDSLLYLTPALQPHKYYNLYSDTAAYFLSWSLANGKRMPLVNVTTTKLPLTYHLDESLSLFTDAYEVGTDYSEVHLSQFDQGEGWFSNYFTGTSSYTINAKNIFSSGPWSSLDIELVGSNNTGHLVTISLGNPASPDTSFTLPQFNFHTIYKFKGLINPAYFSASGNLKVNVSVVNPDPTDATSSYISLAYLKLTYPQTTDMDNASVKYFTLTPNAQDTSYLQIANPSLPALVFDITSKDNIMMINPVVQSGLLKLVVPNTSAGRKLYVSTVNLQVPAILPVNLTNYPTTANFIIITHTKLLTSATSYANYRATIGGGYNTLVTDVNRLYDLFTYGEKSPTAIRRFAKYLLNNGAPEYLFLIGKGMGVNFSFNGQYFRRNPNYLRTTPDNNYHLTVDDLVPPAGLPGSDVLYTMGLDNTPGNEYVPAIMTGRLAARTDAEVINYLDKVKEHEQTVDSNYLWRKNIIHISGGDDVPQIAEFKGYVNNYKRIAEGPLFGAKVVKTFSKGTDNSVDATFKQSVADEVNKGASLVTFFGHSSPAVTDVDFGMVSVDFFGYANKGKYPLLLVNGCYSANLFNYYSYSEDWIVTRDRGAIAVIGHTDLGFPFLLDNYSTNFYQTAFTNPAYFTKSIGAIQKKVITSIASSSVFDQASVTEMILHGDPAVRIYGPSRNDYSILDAHSTDQQLFIKSYNNSTVTAVSDSFAIGIIVSNYGQVVPKDSFAVTVTRSVNNTNSVVYGPVMYPAVYYKDTIYFKIKSKDIATFGDNKFAVKVDALDSIPEMREDNNATFINYFMPLSSVTALSPREYSIINSTYLNASNQITLVAQSTDLIIGPTDYYFEIDTSHLFNSPFHKFSTINGAALATWKTTLLSPLADSVVYYWRARLNQVPAGQDTLWGESSFIYIGGSPEGWSQSEFAQFTKDKLSGITLDVAQRKWNFEKTTTKVFIKNVGTSYPPNPSIPGWRPAYETEVSVNNIALFFNDNYNAGCDPGMIAMAFDKNTAEPYRPSQSGIGFICGTSPILNNFSSLSVYSPGNPYDQSALINYIDAIPDGDYILLCSNGEIYGSSWDTLLNAKFKTALGSRLVDSISNGRPYIILAKKGNYPIGGGPLPLSEQFGSVTSALSLDTTLSGTANTGTITSTLIGPATQWGSLFRNIDLPDAADKYDLKIIKIKADGTQVVDTINPFGTSYNLNSKVDPTVYPYIKLVASVYDSVNLTPPQLDKWQVVYAGVPEGTMNPDATNNLGQYLSFTKTAGQNTNLTFVFTNIFNLDFPDSIKVKFTITNENGHVVTNYITLPPLKKDSSVSFKYTIGSSILGGKNVFQAFVNPRLQPEQNYDNNIMEIPFIMEKDKTNPVLDVVFDGQHIMNGDIVSPSPLIVVSLNDENKYLVKTDTLGMEIFLQSPGLSYPTKINLSDLNVVYGQESGSRNTFRIEYHPKDLQDGVYTLIVQGADVSGNKSGARMYEVKFEVVNEVAISYFYPYPNPFSTSTRFVFTLTGSEVPEDIKIQIMTVTGKVVREIMKNEIGPIRIGNNKTEYAWDGTDEFGDKLANGVYLYRVILKGGDDFKHKQTAGDKAFKKDWGKLYILR